MEADSDQFKFSVQGKTIVFKMGPMYEEDSLIDVREKVSSALTLAMQNKNVQRIVKSNV